MDEATKEAVEQRAAGLCEYCHLPEAHVAIPFHVEHIIAKQHRGKDSAGNLAWACLRCNLQKGPNLVGIDPKTKKITRLFNPRRHVWARHFRLEGAILIGKTAVGRTTVEVLDMNDLLRVRLRQELIQQGLFPS
ncbi:MAG: HNH endonuclease [Planctomycetes bacterium]|nr:HNH endonuclease [Planctomycetota bacterium]